MQKLLIVLAVSVAVSACSTRPPDAPTVLRNVSMALGAADLHSMQLSATGYVSNGGSSYMPDGPGPKFNATLTRQIDFDRGIARDELTRTAHEDPPRGAGQQPL